MFHQPSKHNIISPVAGTEEFVIVNILSGNADIISSAELDIIQGIASDVGAEEFVKKGYLSDPSDEELRYQLKYIEFLESREKEELQIFFVPTYSCNFSCTYCYQSEYPSLSSGLNHQITDAFFRLLEQNFSQRRKYVTLFGGEPLMGSSFYKTEIEYFISKCKSSHLDLAIVTNGYHLGDYLDILAPSFVREIQITIDGTEEVHNKRRRLKKNDGPTFNTIADNVDACLACNIPVNLRVVIDKGNINNLPLLADFAIAKGWTRHPLFKTQIGRNYELHYCQAGSAGLFDRLTLYQELYRLIKIYPHIAEFHKPSYSIMKFLHENGELPKALFDACPACKTEWAMDYTGNIYSCTATVGKPGESLGKFHPDIQMDADKIKIWQQRDVLHIPQCRECNLQLVCGGGCGSIACNEHGIVISPDCRPIDALVGIGAAAYFS
jgi:uncharacterized protein